MKNASIIGSKLRVENVHSLVHPIIDMRYLLFLVLVVITKASSAQQVFPTTNDQPEWNVIDGFGSFELSFFNTHTWSYSGDTVICGQTYSKVEIPIEWTAAAYVRVDGERAYIRRALDCDSTDYLLYDHSLAVGDTVLCAAYGYALGQHFGTARFWVEAIDTIIAFGIPRQRSVMGFYDDDEFPLIVHHMEWVRGIGSLYHPFYPLVQVLLNGHIWHETICYWEMDEQLYESEIWQTCDTAWISTSIPEVPALVASIGPNPFTQNITLELDSPEDKFSISLYSAFGILIERKEVLGSRSKLGDDLLPGSYFLQIEQGGNTQVLRIVKI